MIELKDKEKQFYLSILENFLSKVDKSESFSLDSFNYRDFYNENFRVFNGVTKVVLIPKNKGAKYVIKVPIRGDKMDWCAAEVNAYQAAVEAGTERFFAETSFFYRDDFINSYLQVRTNANDNEDEDWDIEEDWSGLSEESIDSADVLDICDELIDRLLADYSSEEVEEFLEFCTEEQINDLHGCNFGFDRETGVPVVFDYSGIGGMAEQRRGVI